MATIQSLPPELLVKIFRIAGQAEQTWQSRSSSPIHAAALIGRSWRQPAQKVHWEEANFRKASRLDAYLAESAATGLCTSRLELDGHSGGEPVQAAGVFKALRSCRGLQYLQVYCASDFDLVALCGPHLAGELRVLCSRWVRPS